MDFASELVFISVNQPVNVGMMSGNAHNHQNKCPDNHTGVSGAEEKGKDKKRDYKQHASDRDILKKNDHCDGQGNAQEGRQRKTVKHDAAGCGYAFSSAEVKENRPVMSDHTE